MKSLRQLQKGGASLWSIMEKNTDKIAISSFTAPVLQSVFLAVFDHSGLDAGDVSDLLDI